MQNKEPDSTASPPSPPTLKYKFTYGRPSIKH